MLRKTSSILVLAYVLLVLSYASIAMAYVGSLPSMRRAAPENITVCVLYNPDPTGHRLEGLFMTRELAEQARDALPTGMKCVIEEWPLHDNLADWVEFAKRRR